MKGSARTRFGFWLERWGWWLGPILFKFDGDAGDLGRRYANRVNGHLVMRKARR